MSASVGGLGKRIEELILRSFGTFSGADHGGSSNYFCVGHKVRSGERFRDY